MIKVGDRVDTMDNRGNVTHHTSHQEDIDELRNLNNKESELKFKVIANYVYAILGAGAMVLIGYITKNNFTPVWNPMTLFGFGAVIPVVKFGTDGFKHSEELKKVRHDIQVISEHIETLEHLETKGAEKELSQREYEEAQIYSNGIEKGTDQRIDDLIQAQLDDREKERQANLAKSNAAKGIKPVSESLNDGGIPDIDDEFNPEELIDGGRRR